MDSKVLLSEMSCLFEEYSSKHPKRGVSSFSQRSGVNESTLRRAFSGTRLPNFSNCLKILHELHETKNLAQLHSVATKNQKVFIEEHLPQFMDEASPVANITASENLLMGLSDRALFIYMTVSIEESIAKEDFQKQFGQSGMKTLKSLLDLDLLIFSQDGHIQPSDKNIRLTEEASVFIYTRYMQQSYEQRPERSLNYGIHNQVSDSGYEALKVVHLEAAAKIRKIVTENPGKRSVCSFQAMVSQTGGER